MKTEKKTVQDLITERGGLINKREGLSVKMNEIIDKASAEKRDFTPEEEVKYKSLEREFEQASRDIAMNNDLLFASKNGFVENKSKNAMFREFLQEVKGKRSSSECILQREFTGLDTAAIVGGGMIPLTIKDVLPPLEMGLIFDKVGIPVQTGVTGDIQWPVLGSVEAEIKGETEALTDQDIDLSKINAKHVRLGISIKISNQAINDSYTDLVSLVQSQIRAGLNRTLNRVIFSHQNFTSDLHGPFASAKASGTFAGATPTYKELLEMKGKIASTGVEMIGFCYIMSEAMKAALEATPVDAGSGRMIIENGAIAGYPVFCTEYINYGSSKEKADVEYVAAGCFGYLPTNQHGEVRMIFDPYTQAKNDVIVITMNADWSITTLRKEAFALYKTTEA
jgi:HK97 family phage major capsid protein